jgi:hypothetical protein
MSVAADELEHVVVVPGAGPTHEISRLKPALSRKTAFVRSKRN